MSNVELHWLAFRYVSGEMTDQEQELFEQQLAEDQAAREAVEQAVEMLEAVRLVSSEPASLRPSIFRRRIAWVAAAAAGLFLIVCTSWWRSVTPPNPDSAGQHADHVLAPNHAPDSAQVVSAWAELQREQVREDPAFGPAEPDMPPNADMEIVESPPSWLLTAVLAETQPLKEKK